MAPAAVTVAVIGAGIQGRAFALACARAGHRVVLEDVLPSKLREAAAAFEAEFQTCASESGNFTFASTVEDAVREADFAIDFVPDELESKLELVSMIDRMAPPRTVLLINTTALDVDDLASCTYRADRSIGIRFTPAPTLTAGIKTSAETLAATQALIAAL